MRVFPGSRREALVGLVVALAQAALGATKNGQAAEPGYVTAVNLSPEARQRAYLSDADRDYIRGSEREQREWARNEFRRELDLTGDGPGEAAYGGSSLLGFWLAPTGSMPVGAQDDTDPNWRQCNLESLRRL